MRPETRAELARRLHHYLDTGTTAMAEAMFANPVSAYMSEERLALIHFHRSLRRALGLE